MTAAKLQHMQIAPYTWFDGALREHTGIGIDAFAHGLHYGTGVFEGIRAYATARGPAIFRLREHMERFERSAAVYGLALGRTVDEMCAAVCETVTANQLDSAYIRPLAFFGEKTISLAPRFHCPTHVLIALRALGNYFGAGQARGIRVTLSSWRKFSSQALPAHVKGCGHYANSVLAMHEAVARGFDEALLLNDRGQLSEGTGENFFLVKNGIVRTNDESADILPGLTRASVLALCDHLDIPTEIGPLTLDDLNAADEVFVTGTAVEVTPVVALDERTFAAGPITERLCAAYTRAVTGQDPAHAAWVTYADQPERSVA